jgi:cell pole-organizing protein PopZ
MSTDALMEAAFAALTGAGQPSSQPRDAYGRPLAAEPRQASYTNPYAPGYGSRPDPAAAALDALAQGLAAPQRAEPLHRAYDTYQSAPSHAPTALVPQPLPPAIQEYYPQAIRTLEDSVADMLKPLLQKWLADNMPRIIERALRVEAASGMKPPGSS